MLGSALILSLLLGAGASFAPEAGLQMVQVVSGKKKNACYKLAPRATFTVTGKAKAAILLWLDLPAKPKKPKAVNVTVSIDGKKKKHKMRAKRAKKNRYDSAGKLKPSKLAKIKLRVPKGKHELVIQLPKNRSGCVAFKGLKLMAKPEPKLADAPELPTPEPEPEPEPEPAPELAVVAVAPEPKLALNLPAADAELDLVAAPASEASEDSAIHEIRAQSIEEPPIEVEEEAVPSTEGSTSKVATMGLGLELGMVIPRGALNLAPTVALRFEMDLTSIVPGSIDVAGLPTELGAFASAGWVHLAYQDNETMVPGRGTGQLIQNSMVFPLDLGVSVRVFPVADIGVVAALGFAGDISRTQIDAFSLETESQNDFSVGYSLSVGATLKVPTGQIFVQLRQREIGADLDTWQNVAEPQMASTGFSLGYVFSFAE